MKKAVLVIGDEADIHVASVTTHLKASGTEVLILNFGHFPTQIHLSQAISTGLPHRLTIGNGNSEILLSDAWAVWKRRVGFASAHESIADPADRISAESDIRAFVTGFIYSVQEAGIRMVNNPKAEIVVNSKLYQLEVAKSLGCRVPHTLVTNSASEVIGFREQMNDLGREVVYKPLTQSGDRLLATQKLADDDVQRLNDLRFAPTIFQEYCSGRSLRITVVGDDVFAAEVVANSEEGCRDWRLEPFHGVQRIQLTAQEDAIVRRLMQKYELDYGAFDFIRTDQEELVFLEVNPGGQFLFVEIRAGLPISRAVAHELLRSRKGTQGP